MCKSDLLIVVMLGSYLQKLTYDFKSLTMELPTSSEDAYTPINQGLAVLFDESFQLNSDNARYIVTHRCNECIVWALSISLPATDKMQVSFYRLRIHTAKK